MLDNLLELQVKQTAKQLGIPADFIRKDFYITKAIQALVNVHDDYFGLVFQGGTSLSKGYQIIQRMSEDVDFRVFLKVGKKITRSHLRNFRRALINALVKGEFLVNKDQIKVFYEGRFMSIYAEYDNSATITYLKPHIAIECFVGDLLLKPQMREMTSLIKVVLGNECNHPLFPINCIALDETAAEKWVALTRRIANAQEKTKFPDKNLVRHLYDLYHLNQQKLLTGEYIQIINIIIEKDKEMFKNKNKYYTQNPIKSSFDALEFMFTNKQWHEHWNIFLEQMVYEKNKPTFDQACEQLRIMSQNILEKLTY